MPYKTPDQIAQAAVVSGTAKANLSPDRMLAAGILAGAYIGFASLLAVTVTSGLSPKTWGTLPTLVFGAAFSLGLILVILAGSELLTGNMALLPLAFLHRRIRVGRIGLSFGVVLVGNLVGSLLVAYFFAVKTGVIGSAHSEAGSQAALTFARLAAIAKGKAVTETSTQIFLRAVACNWLVCLAVWIALAADDVGGKILGIFFPITAFVAMGFDHVVANMFFLPAAMFAHAPGIGWGDVAHNLVLALVGNFVGAALFVAAFYWFLYLRGTPTEQARTADATGAEPASAATSGLGMPGTNGARDDGRAAASRR